MSFGDHPNGEYRTVDGKCYYYQKSGMEYEDAVTNCKAKFNGNGRLFEPRGTKDSDTKIYKQAQQLDNNTLFWIGIRTQVKDIEHEFYYISEGPSTSLAYDDGWAFAEPDDASGNEDCVSVLRFKDLGWSDDNCDLEGFYICELDEEKGKG